MQNIKNMNKKNILIAVLTILIIVLFASLMAGKKETVAPTAEDLQETVSEETSAGNGQNSAPKPQAPSPTVVQPQVSSHALPPATVRYTNEGFSPTTITISKGGSVQFINESNQQMWVASNPHPSHSAYPAFDQRISVGRGGTYTFTFTEIGKWYFHNHMNSSRTGLVIVK